MAGRDVIAEIGSTCVLMRSRLVATLITGIYDEELQPFGIGSALFALLVVIYKNEPANRAKLGRLLHLDRSTLTWHRNPKCEEPRSRTRERNRGSGHRIPRRTRLLIPAVRRATHRCNSIASAVAERGTQGSWMRSGSAASAG